MLPPKPKAKEVYTKRMHGKRAIKNSFPDSWSFSNPTENRAATHQAKDSTDMDNKYQEP